MKILFVCRANRGRSQMAASLYNKYAKNGHADSAGTLVETPHVSLGEHAKESKPQAHVITVIGEEGVDISKNLQTPLKQEVLDQYDKVIVMAEEHTIPDWLSSHPKYEYWVIEDPRWDDVAGVRGAKDSIKKRVLELIKQR